METYHVGLIGLALFALLALLALLAWRRRISAQELLLPKPFVLETSDAGNKCFYVATTFAARPLDRVIAHGLAYRGHAALSLSQQGLQVERVGELGFTIPASNVIGVSTGSAVIDRVVEKEGLVVIKWRLGSTELESHFRFTDVELREKTLASLSSFVGA